MEFVFLKRFVVVCFLGLACVISTGCMAGRGVRMTRQPFNEAAHYTAKQEMLLNIVRLKYREPPQFMALSSINESLSYSAGGSASFSPFNLAGWDFFPSASESPNFTYAPLESDEFNRRLINPIPKDVLDLLGATNWSPGHLLRVTVKNINDIDNASNAGGPTPKTAPEFAEFKIAMDILDKLRESRQVEITHISDEDNIQGIKEKRVLRDPKHAEPMFAEAPGSTTKSKISEAASGLAKSFQNWLSSEKNAKLQAERDLISGLRSLTKSELEWQLENLTEQEKKKILGDGNASSTDFKEKLEKALRETGVDTDPFAQKLFRQIRNGLAPDEEAAAGSDQVVLRFEAESLQYPEVANFQQIFNLVQATSENPFYNIQRADWGQLRRRDQFKKYRKQIELWASPRSFLEVMYFLSQGINIPQEHYAKGLVTRTQNPDGTYFNWSEVTGDLLNVCVSKRRPNCASTAVQYRGYWYYIEDNDLESKSTFGLITQIYNMAVVSGAVGVVPQLTIAR